jgi:hypothetical protein
VVVATGRLEPLPDIGEGLKWKLTKTALCAPPTR